MDETFNPSLLISLGPSGGKALNFSKKLLSYLPEHFLNVIDYYCIEGMADMAKDVQAIVDTKLLSARYLNRLVDLGYKVRSENVSAVKINIYLLWDVYNSTNSAYDAVKLLSDISYGNIDKDQHSGVSLYIIPMMDKEWLLEEKNSLQSMKKLNSIIDLVSQQENILSLDSKIYVLHCISNDGTRIPKEELEYICGILTYLNILPSKDPPLAHFNRRLLMNEGSYKVGTVGITTLTVFKDKLLNDFSRYMAVDILSYTASAERNIDFSSNLVFNLISYDIQRNILRKDVSIVDQDGSYKLSNIKKFEIELPKDISDYQNMFKNWEEYIEHQCLTDMKKTIDKNNTSIIDNIIDAIDEDLEDITLKYSLKEAVNYINSLEEGISKQKPNNKSSINIDTSRLNRELGTRVNNYPNLIGYIIKCLILGAFFLYSMINIVFPLLTQVMNIFSLIVFFAVFCGLAYLDYLFTQKKFKTFIERYKEEIFKKSGALINLYIEKSIVEGQKRVLTCLSNRKAVLESCIKNCNKISKNIPPVPSKDEENLGNLITDLLNFQDREGFYKERSPKISEVYSALLKELGKYDEFQSDSLEQKLLDFTQRTSQKYIDLDFFEYMRFKYKENIKEELSEWIDKGIIKSKYLLQYINNDLLEEHSLFITSPEVYRVASDMRTGKLSSFQVSILEGKDIYTNCISIIRLCLGVDFNNITPVKKVRKNTKPEEEDLDNNRGENNA